MGAPPGTGIRTMGDTTLRDHLTIVAQLPDFVLGKLDETGQGGAPRSAIVESSVRGGGEQRVASARNGQRRSSFGKLVPRWALVAASAAVLLVSGLVGWGSAQRNGNAV